MNKKDVIEFFDSRSSSWDKEMETDDYKMNQILDAAQIESGKSVLDIACGTGVGDRSSWSEYFVFFICKF